MHLNILHGNINPVLVSASAWTYDARGRKPSETKWIFSNEAESEAESFTTRWTYNSADLAVSMTYPDGEVLTSAYNAQGALDSLTNTTGFTYVKDAAYDSAGRLTALALGDSGGSAVLNRAYTYNGWNVSQEGGRLQQLTTTNASNSDISPENIEKMYLQWLSKEIRVFARFPGRRIHPALGKRGEEICRLHDRKERWLIILDIASYQAIHLILYRCNHLHCIFKIRISQVQCLLNGTLIHRKDFQKLQKVGNDRSCICSRPSFLNQIVKGGNAVGRHIACDPARFHGCQKPG